MGHRSLTLALLAALTLLLGRALPAEAQAAGLGSPFARPQPQAQAQAQAPQAQAPAPQAQAPQAPQAPAPQAQAQAPQAAQAPATLPPVQLVPAPSTPRADVAPLQGSEIPTVVTIDPMVATPAPGQNGGWAAPSGSYVDPYGRPLPEWAVGGPPAPGPGFVPVRFTIDTTREFVLTQLLATAHATAHHGFTESSVDAESFGLVCVLPCVAWVPAGAHRLGVGSGERPRWRSPILQLDRPVTVPLHFVDRGPQRLVGGLVLLASIASLVAGAYEVVGEQDGLAAVAFGSGALVGTIVSLVLLFHGDSLVFPTNRELRF